MDIRTTITEAEVAVSFREANNCEGAMGCLAIRRAMNDLYRLNNQRVIEEDSGLVIFTAPVEGPCPNQDQLFCQDRINT